MRPIEGKVGFTKKKENKWRLLQLQHKITPGLQGLSQIDEISAVCSKKKSLWGDGRSGTLCSMHIEFFFFFFFLSRYWLGGPGWRQFFLPFSLPQCRAWLCSCVMGEQPTANDLLSRQQCRQGAAVCPWEAGGGRVGLNTWTLSMTASEKLNWDRLCSFKFSQMPREEDWLLCFAN